MPIMRMSVMGPSLLVVLATLAPQRGGVDAQDLGRFVLGARARGDAQDVLALDGLEAEVAAQDRLAAAMGPDALGQGGGLEDLAGPHDGGALDGVAQLTDVARPVVRGEG